MSQSTEQKNAKPPQSLVIFEGFSGLNTQPSRYGLDDKECAVMDGFFPSGNSLARVIPDNAPAAATYTSDLVYFDFGNIGPTPYAIIFLTDGSVWSLNTNTNVTNKIANAGTMVSPGSTSVAVSQWGAQFILIVNLQTNGYFVWDGTTFYAPGGVIPGVSGPGPIASSTLVSGGQNYDVGDTGTVTGGVNDAIYVVNTVTVDGTDYAVGDTGTILTGSADATYIVDTVSAGGKNYTVGDTGTILTGSADATYTVATVGANGSVATVNLTADGTNYTTGTNVATVAGGGQPGVGVGLLLDITAHTSGSPITSISVDSGGGAYAVGDTGAIAAGSGDATYIVNSETAGVVVSASLTFNGTNYTSGTNVPTSGNGPQPGIGTGLTLNVTAPTIHPLNAIKVGTGSVLSATLTNAGTSYTTGNNIATATGGAQPGGGTGLEFDITASTPGGPITGITLTILGSVITYTLTADGTLYIPEINATTATGGAQPGGGTGLTLDISVTSGTVPSGIGGNAIETFNSYVWIANGDQLIWSAPASFLDFSTADGGGSLISNNSTLRVIYTKLKQTNGYLYLFGDSSISYVAGVQTTGSPPTTSFSLQNVDPEVGTPWPDTVDVLGSNIVFANAWGAHVSYGGRAAKISPQLDGIYNTVPGFGGQVASGAKAILFGKRVWILLLTVIDQITFQQIRKLFIWDEKRWCSTQQSAALFFIGAQEIDSVLTAWGTDGVSIYQLFQNPGAALTKTLRSKFWAPSLAYAEVKSETRFWGLIQFFSGGPSALTVSIDSEFGPSPKTIAIAPPAVTWFNSDGAVVPWRNNSGELVTWTTGNDGTIVLAPNSCGQQGALVGITVSTNASDIAIISVATMPIPVAYRG